MSKQGQTGESGPSQPKDGAENATPAPFSIALESRGNTIQLLPAGRFAATDGSGRPKGLDGWFIDAEIAAELIERNRAIAAGAVDFIAVEPFHVLSLLRTLEETLRLFG